MPFSGIPDATLAATYAQVLNAVGAIIWRADARTFQTTFVTPAAEAILGYPLHVWLDVPGFWVDHIHPDDLDAVISLSAAATREGRTHDFEYRMIAAGGRVVWLRNIVNVVMQNGVPDSLIGITVDRTAAKLAEMETDRLRRQLTSLSRLAERDEFGVMLAHEMNQPLGALVTNAETARLLVERNGPVHQLRLLLSDMEADAHRATEIVASLRRIRSESALVPEETTTIASAIDSAVRVSAPLLASEQVDVVIDVMPDVPPVRIYPVAFQQVLVNVLMNAVEAMASVPRTVRRIRIGVRRTADAVVMTVADTGVGVASDLSTRVFDRGYSTKNDGLGMGLAICRSFVEAAGGRISLEASLDSGATVTVTLRPAITRP